MFREKAEWSNPLYSYQKTGRKERPMAWRQEHGWIRGYFWEISESTHSEIHNSSCWFHIWAKKLAQVLLKSLNPFVPHELLPRVQAHCLKEAAKTQVSRSVWRHSVVLGRGHSLPYDCQPLRLGMSQPCYTSMKYLCPISQNPHQKAGLAHVPTILMLGERRQYDPELTVQPV